MTASEEQERDRRLRLLKSAAASALFNGATPDEAREALEAGFAEAQANPIYQRQLEEQRAAA